MRKSPIYRKNIKDYLERLLQNKWANDIGTEVMLRRGFTKCYITPEFQTAHYGPNTPPF